MRILGLTEKTRIYQASTSELYGLVQEIPQKESTPFVHAPGAPVPGTYETMDTGCSVSPPPAGSASSPNESELGLSRPPKPTAD